MKIIQLVSSVYPIAIGGVEMHVYNLSQELVRKGHQVEILTKKGRYTISINRELILAEKMSIIKILKYLLTKNYDIVHIHNWGIMPFGIFKNESAFFICKLRKKKIVMTPHGFPDIISSRAMNNIRAKAFLIFSKLMLKMIDKFICVFPQQETTLHLKFGIHKTKIIFIPNGIPDSAFKQYDPKDFLENYALNGKRILCYVGRIVPNKRLSDVIEVMHKLNKKIDDLLLIIIGPDGGGMSNLLGLIDKYGLKNTVLLGELNERKKYQVLSVAHIFVSPSSSEAFGISTCEAMAQGVPVISANNLGAKYLLSDGEYGLLYEIGDIDSLLEEILCLLDSPEKAKKMGEKGRERATKFRWSKIAGEIEKV
ncbi:MAG TPA: hypothetical protein C5S37_06095, partial [Methanophagales archaeon]|nr:hypothetical protein [Methanophagales archaeon]